VPLIGTMLFPKAEFYCLDCGGHFGFLQPAGAAWTPELEEQLQALKADWDEHVKGKAIVERGWDRYCALCNPGQSYHMDHATPEQLAAHEGALAWLKERAA
jgi:hypothetical protein